MLISLHLHWAVACSCNFHNEESYQQQRSYGTVFHFKMGEKYTVFSEKYTNRLPVIAKVKGFKFGSCLDHLDG